MACPLCKTNVPLVRRIVQSAFPFCSDAHRTQFATEISRLMVERLGITRERYAAYRRQPISTQPPRIIGQTADGRSVSFKAVEQTS